MAEFLDVIQNWESLHPIKGQTDPAYIAQLAEVERLVSGQGYKPHEREYLLREALTTSSFPYLFGDVLDRALLATYNAVPPVWMPIVKQSTLKDFRTAYRFAITDGDQTLPRVYEKGEYLASNRLEERFSISLGKYGRQFDISWEAIINDDLNALQDTPARMSTAVSRTEHRLVTGLFAGDVGTHTANANLFEVGVNAVATAFSFASLRTGLQHFATLTDDNGEPILARPKYLYLPPALELLGMQVLSSTNVQWLADADDVTPPAEYGTANILRNFGLTIIVDPYLPILDTTSDEEGWYLFCPPSEITSLEVAKLAGHERPEICMKASDKVAVGGGSLISPMEGDFATDNIIYRVRHVFGGAAMDWRGCYMGGYQG